MDCGERWGVFTAGMGVDGAVVAAVEAQREKGRKVTASRYIRVAIREVLASARREPTLTLHLPDREPISGVHFAFVSNSSPWTYANARPVWTNPTTTFETGLGLFATTSMNVWANLGLVRRMNSRKPKIEARHLVRDDDLRWLRVSSDDPGGLPDRRGLRRIARNHDVHVGTGCAWRGCTARKARLTCDSAITLPDLGRKWFECSTNG